MNQEEIDMIRTVEKLTRGTIARHPSLNPYEKELINSVVTEMANEIIDRGMRRS